MNIKIRAFRRIVISLAFGTSNPSEISGDHRKLAQIIRFAEQFRDRFDYPGFKSRLRYGCLYFPLSLFSVISDDNETEGRVRD